MQIKWFFFVSLPPQFWLDTDQVLIMPHSPFHPLFPTPYDCIGFSKFWEWGQRERSETESVLLDWYNWSTGIGALWVSLNGQILIFFYESFVDLFGDHMHTCTYVHRLSHISWDFLLGPPSIVPPAYVLHPLAVCLWLHTSLLEVYSHRFYLLSSLCPVGVPLNQSPGPLKSSLRSHLTKGINHHLASSNSGGTGFSWNGWCLGVTSFLLLWMPTKAQHVILDKELLRFLDSGVSAKIR